MPQYQARGLDEGQARAMASKIISDEAVALDTLTREELGVDPRSLGGSAWKAALTSLVLFAVGAIVPVIPFIVLTGTAAAAASVAFSAVALFVIGAGITLFTSRPVPASSMRQVLFGLTAAAVTYAIGRLIGVSIGG